MEPMTASADDSTAAGTDPDRSSADAPAAGIEAEGPADADAAAPAPWAWWVLGTCVAAVIASAIQIGLGRPDHGVFLITLCFLVCIVAACLDVATRRIPNVLTYPAIGIGLLVNAMLPPLLDATGAQVAVTWSGATGLRDGLLGFGLCAVIGIISFIARGLGGGDVKMLGAVGAMLGLQAVLAVLFNTLLIAALIGLTNWALKGTLAPRLQVVANNMLTMLVTRSRTKVYPFGRSEAPFGLALLLGLTLAQFVALHKVLLHIGW